MHVAGNVPDTVTCIYMYNVSVFPGEGSKQLSRDRGWSEPTMNFYSCHKRTDTME